MDVLQTLAIALGLAALSGYSLYLTVFLTGLAVHFDWIHLAPQYASLSVLGNPPVIIVSGILFVIEFFVDKIPWVDSLWDAIHTVIRPIGGALLAIQALGHPNPVFDVIVGLIAGSVTFTSHSVKTGTRLLVNQSPEPFSNVAVSLGENLLVGGTFALLWSHPLIALGILLVLFSIAFYFLPRIWRTIRIRLFFIRRKLKQPARRAAVELLAKLPRSYEHCFRRLVQPPKTIRWAVPCISGKGLLIPKDQFGYLTAIEEERGKLFFLVKGWFGAGKLFEIEEFEPSLRQRFLYDEVILFTRGKTDRYSFRIDRMQTGLAALVVEDVKRQIEASRPLVLMPPNEPVAEKPAPARVILEAGDSLRGPGEDGHQDPGKFISEDRDRA
jgi:hypothetical protein